MDRSLFGGGGRKSFTPHSRMSMSAGLMTGRRSLAGGLKKPGSSRFSVSGRSTQSVHVVAKSDYNTVECFGMPLPILVSEALTFADRNSSIAIKCEPNGWAFAIKGRKLFVWQYKESEMNSPLSELPRTPQRRATSSQCRELTLPHCDIGHKVSLISVFVHPGHNMASCLAVSPTGDVRYWPSVAHDGSSIDENGILDGQEFHELLSIPPIGYIIATTTCNLVLLKLQLHGGRHAISHKAIKPPSGFFGGLSRKFASILIGMHNNQDKESKFLRMCGQKEEDEWTVSVLADRWIQQWNFSSGNEEFLIEDIDIMKKITEAFHSKIWSNRNIADIHVTLLDMQSSESDVIILASGVNLNHTPRLHYALCFFNVVENVLTLRLFLITKHTEFCDRINLDDPPFQMRCIIFKEIAYLYNKKTIYPVVLNGSGNDEMEKIEFPAIGDILMTATISKGIPLFFSRLHGIVCVQSSDFEPFDGNLSTTQTDGPMFSSFTASKFGQSMQDLGSLENLTLLEFDPDQIYNLNKEGVTQMKAALIYYLKQNTSKCEMILNELFPPEENTLANNTDKFLDQIVVTMAQNLADDVPAADPRWEEQMSAHALGSSNSMQIIQQLRDKHCALTHFIDFLKATELWPRLRAVSHRGHVKSTCYLLADIGEKIIAAIALKEGHNKFASLLDDAIMKVIENRAIDITGGLTAQDLFYAKVTKFEELFRVLLDMCSECVKYEHSEAVPTIIEINTIFLMVLNEVISFRESKGDQLAPIEGFYDYTPWTIASGKTGLKESLSQLIKISLDSGVRATGEPEYKQKLYQQIMELTDFLLNGRKVYLESIRDPEKRLVMVQQFESQRRELIYPFVEDGQYELAIQLAEKYLDFNILVQVCDRTKNKARLDEYIERYKNYNFSAFAINWHLREKKHGDIFERFKSNQTALTKFLGDHPSLGWIQLMSNGEYVKSANILFDLAKNELELLSRKKTILSLAKLASLAAGLGMENLKNEIDKELMLIEYQEHLSATVMSAFGYDTTNPKVLQPLEIINLYISDENETATECDFRKALELLVYVDDAYDVKHKIWCAAIRRDTWEDYNINDPSESLQKFMFFKLIDLCYMMDGELGDILPPVEDFLVSGELDELTTKRSFQFLIKLGYEHIASIYKPSDSMSTS